MCSAPTCSPTPGPDWAPVVDVIVEIAEGAGGQCDVVGYEVEASAALGTKEARVFIPLPDTIAASGDHLLVPASASDFIAPRPRGVWRRSVGVSQATAGNGLMWLSEALGRALVDSSTAQTVGQVAEFVIDPKSHSIVAVTLRRTQLGDTVLWTALSAFGEDALTVPGAEVILDANDAVAALAGKDHRVFGKRVLNTDGEDLGTLTDADFDPATGRLTELLLTSGTVRGDRLIGIGSYAAIVHADTNSTARSTAAGA